MKIFDISQELFGGKVYPGDMEPGYKRKLKISDGAPCNLTELWMGAHNATHMDAPYHFYDDGKTIEELELSRCIGPCTVVSLEDNNWDGIIKILERCHKRLLIKGSTIVSLELAELINRLGIVLVGVESQSVGPEAAPAQVHLELLKNEVVILEGLVLGKVPEGDYFLSAAPIKLGGSDGAPCRAVLLELGQNGACDY